MSRAVDANRILEEILALRRRHAATSAPSWAPYQFEPEMARTPEAVDAFQGPLFEAFGALAEVEYAAMSANSYDDDLQRGTFPYYDQRRPGASNTGVDTNEVSAYRSWPRRCRVTCSVSDSSR